jgi:hypothetical protein
MVLTGDAGWDASERKIDVQDADRIARTLRARKAPFRERDDPASRTCSVVDAGAAPPGAADETYASSTMRSSGIAASAHHRDAS